jgi:hypothetical protein
MRPTTLKMPKSTHGIPRRGCLLRRVGPCLLGHRHSLVAPDAPRAMILAANPRIHVAGAARTLLELVVSPSLLETCR